MTVLVENPLLHPDGFVVSDIGSTIDTEPLQDFPQLAKKLENLPPNPKIAIVCVPFPVFEGKTVFPSGALYTYAAFKEHFPHGEIQFIDVHQEGLAGDQVIERVADCDAVGLSINVFSFPQAEELINGLHEKDPGKLIFAGGSLPTAVPDVFLTELPGLDLVFLGESERTVGDLNQVIQGQRELNDLSGIALRDKDGNTINKGPNLPDLALDVPDFPPDALGNYRGSISVADLRGCIYHCEFCGMERRYKGLRLFPEDKFRKQLEMAVELKQTHVALTENQFFAGKREDVERKIDILRQYYKKHDLTWSLVSTPYPEVFTPQMLERLSSSGCAGIDLHTASVAKEVQETSRIFNGKLSNVTLEKYIEVVENIKQAGINVSVLLNLGLPGETPQSLRMAVDFIHKTGVHCYNPRTRLYPGSHWWNQKCMGDGEFALKYLRGGFEQFLHQPSSMKPLTVERIERETEYVLCSEYLKKRVALAIRYVQEISSTINFENSGIYTDSKNPSDHEITTLLGEKKLISTKETLVLQSKNSQKEVGISELPFSYHYLLSHFKEYQREGENNYAMMRAISETVKDYLMFIGSGNEFVTPENFRGLYSLVLEGLKREHQKVFESYCIDLKAIEGVKFASRGISLEASLKIYTVWKERMPENQEGVANEKEEIIDIYANHVYTNARRTKIAQIVWKNNNLQVFLIRKEGEDISGDQRELVYTAPELVSLPRFRGDSSLLFEYLTQTITNGAYADITVILYNIGAMLNIGEDGWFSTYNSKYIYLGAAEEDLNILYGSASQGAERLSKVDYVTIERNPYNRKLVLTQVCKAPKDFYITPHGNMRFCQIDEGLVMESVSIIPDQALRKQVAAWIQQNIDASSPSRTPRKNNLFMTGLESRSSCSFHCFYCFSHANYPQAEVDFYPIQRRYTDEYYDEVFFQYLMNESEKKDFVPVLFFAPETDIGDISLRDQAAMMMVSLIRYNKVAKEQNRPLARMFLVTKAGPDFLETEYKGRQTEFQSKTVKDLLASPEIHLVVAAGIPDEVLAQTWEPGAAPNEERLVLARRYNDEVVAKTAGKHPPTMLMQPLFLPYLERSLEDGSLRLTEKGDEVFAAFIQRIKEAGIRGVSVNVLKCTEENYRRLRQVLVDAGLYHFVEQLEFLLNQRTDDITFNFKVFGRLSAGQVVRRRVSLEAGRVLMTVALEQLAKERLITPVCSIWSKDHSVASVNAKTIYDGTLSGRGMDCTAVPYDFYPPQIRAMEMLQNIYVYRDYLSPEQKNAMAQAALELLSNALPQSLGEEALVHINQKIDLRRNPHQHISEPAGGEYLTPENLDLSEMSDFQQHEVNQFIQDRIRSGNPATAREIEVFIREMVFNGFFDDPFLPVDVDQWHSADISLERNCGAGWYGE